MTETKRCRGRIYRTLGQERQWACADEYPDHMVPIEQFGPDKSSFDNDGLHHKCKSCGKSGDEWRNARISAAEKLVGSQKAFRSMTKAERNEIYAQLDGNVVDIKPKLKSEFGQSTPMTKRETIKVEGEAVPEGWVYVLQNPACTKPWSLKIGKTFPDGLPDIISSARRFGRAELVDMYWFEEAYKAEQKVHELLNHCNLRTLGYTDCGRELFKCTIQEAADAITKVQSENDRPSVAVGE